MFDLSDKTVLVTGSSRGLGREIATTMAALGADVGVNYPSADEEAEAEAVVEAVVSHGRNALKVQADVSSEPAVRTMFDTVWEGLGPIDVLVNNAGVGSEVPIHELDLPTWERTVDVDLTGVFLCAREAAERFSGSATDPARIVNIASQLVFSGAAGLTHYCAAKGGVVSFTRSLAREVAPEMTVNAVAPGPMNTRMLLEGTTEEWREEKRAEIPLGRFAEPGDVAPTVAFLASDAATYYTGQTLSPDGGDAMH